MQQMTFFHLYYFPCEKQPAASPLSSPEEVAEEFLFIRGAVVLDHQSEASGLVLVLGQTELSEVPLIRDVVGVKPLLHLSQSAVHLLVFISAMEEHHLATEHLLDWALVEGGLGEGLGDVVAVLVAGDQSLPPLGVLSQGRSLEVESLDLSGVLCVLLNVDLHLGGQKLQFSQNTTQISHLGGHARLEFSEVLQELHEVVLVNIDQSCVPLGPPERHEIVKVGELEVIEGLVAPGAEDVVVVVQHVE